MKVLVVGGTGIIGTGVVEASYRAGYDTYAVSRSVHKIQHDIEGITYITANWRDDNKARQILRDINPDVIVDGLVFGKNQLRRNLELIKGYCRHYIYVSTSGVYGHGILDARETEAKSSGQLEWGYSANKMKAEEYLISHRGEYNFMCSIVRPPFTYGDTRIPCAVISKKNQWEIINRIKQGKPIVFSDDKDALHAVTHISTFSDALVGIFMKKEADGECFHVADDESYTWDDVINTVGTLVGVMPRIVHLPAEMFEKIDYNLYIELIYNKKESMTLCNEKIKKLSPKVQYQIPLSVGLSNTVNYLENNHIGEDKSFGDFSDIMLLMCDRNVLDDDDRRMVEEYVAQLSEERRDELRLAMKNMVAQSRKNWAKEQIKRILRKVDYYG